MACSDLQMHISNKLDVLQQVLQEADQASELLRELARHVELLQRGNDSLRTTVHEMRQSSTAHKEEPLAVLPPTSVEAAEAVEPAPRQLESRVATHLPTNTDHPAGAGPDSAHLEVVYQVGVSKRVGTSSGCGCAAHMHLSTHSAA
jgi:hypothetical protein